MPNDTQPRLFMIRNADGLYHDGGRYSRVFREGCRPKVWHNTNTLKRFITNARWRPEPGDVIVECTPTETTTYPAAEYRSIPTDSQLAGGRGRRTDQPIPDPYRPLDLPIRKDEVVLKASNYAAAQRELDRLRCSNCYGRGLCDDAEPGDMDYETWECDNCDGTGLASS